MAIVIRVPSVSPDVEHGVLAKWTCAEGQRVEAADPIAELESDKASLDLPAGAGGVLLRHLVAEGTKVSVGTPVAILGEPGEDVSALAAQHGAK